MSEQSENKGIDDNDKEKKRCEAMIKKICCLSYQPINGALSEGQLLRLASTLSLREAAAIMLDISPTLLVAYNSYDEDNQYIFITKEQYQAIHDCTFDTSPQPTIETHFSNIIEDWINSLNAAAKAIKTAIDIGDILTGCNKYTIYTESLRDWLEKKGVYPEFFNLDKKAAPSYLDKAHPRFTPKLNAAIKVWEAMGDNNLYKTSSPKQGIENWLRMNYKELGLINPDGKINTSAITEIAKITNWKTTGGAPKTPE